MFKNILGVFLLVTISFTAIAEALSDIGRPGQSMRVPKDNEFKVCADPNNLPFSNEKQEGFENKIAKVLADDLKKELSFQFWPDRFGFIRNTLKAQRCDVIIGTGSAVDMVKTTKAYYRSGHVWIYRKDSGYNIKDWNSPDLRKAVIGIVDKSPVSVSLHANDLMANAKPYRLMRDLTKDPGQLVTHVAEGKIDIAIMWGPIGGYFAKKSSIPMEVVLIPEFEDTKLSGKTYWNISAAVRYGEKDRLKMLEDALDRNKDKILKILDEFGIPHTEPVFNNKLDGKK
ncbi:quinoprotein dehydrogenase-associated putative ABC transporter substrate-binding protein [Methylophilaceae bacterium]|nr:quinoprotein dehydrogenase-associated putative ABC transporter substrate-binding protein [Methylophilaceae bacterium]